MSPRSATSCAERVRSSRTCSPAATFLFEELSLADVTAFPFLKYAVLWQDGDPDRFHEVLREHLGLDGGYPGLEAWIRRVDALPRA